MHDYTYATLGADGWFHCDGLHRPDFPTLLQDVLYHFGYTGTSTYSGRPYHQFRLGLCKVHMDILAHPTDPTMMAWFTTASGNDLDDTLETAAHQALMEFSERTCWSSVTPPSPCSPFEMRATRCEVSAWPLLATPSFRPTTRVGRSRHVTPSM
jgi:hypothetical protein